mmetsp:Transcript_186/g.496  ORF Transcript_186/g.496 Transcript_186/m.496 type:complete len:332 (-) Transcript_186:58-1053(-)
MHATGALQADDSLGERASMPRASIMLSSWLGKNAEQLIQGPKTFIRQARASLSGPLPPEMARKPSAQTQGDLRAALRSRGGATAPRLSLATSSAPVERLDRQHILATQHREGGWDCQVEGGRQKRNTIAVVSLSSSPDARTSHLAWEKRLKYWCHQNQTPEEHVRLVEASLLPSPSRWRLSLVLQGLEVVVEEGMDAMEQSLDGEEPDRYPKLLSARSTCPWECVQRRVANAEEATLGAPVEFFLEVLLAPDAASTLQPATPDQRQDGVCSESEENVEPLESFAGWLNENSALVRVDAAATNLSWDFPLSKDEKRERLVMFLCHENDSQWR